MTILQVITYDLPVYLGKRPVDFGTGLRAKEREKILCFADGNDQYRERSVMAWSFFPDQLSNYHWVDIFLACAAAVPQPVETS